MTRRVPVATLGSVTTVSTTARALLERVSAVTVDDVAAAHPCSKATAACALGRMFWRGEIDRHRAPRARGGRYTYTVREPR